MAKMVKTDILALAYHQLKTHVVAIRGYTELLMKRISGPLTEKQEWYISNILNHTTELFSAIENFLQTARLEGEELFLRTEKVNPAAVIKEAIDSLRFLANARNAELIFQKPSWKLPHIKTDSVILKQILVNLIYNSCKYHWGKTRVIIAAAKKNNSFEFSIRDNGIGISQDEKPKIFTKFFRGRQARLIDSKGYGLGLYVTKSMVKALGGEIGFESQLNKGSKFWFTLPIHKLNTNSRQIKHKYTD